MGFYVEYVIMMHCLLESVFDRIIKSLELLVTLNHFILVLANQSVSRSFSFSLRSLAGSNDFHLRFSGIVTVFVAVATWGGNYSRVVLKGIVEKTRVLWTSKGYP